MIYKNTTRRTYNLYGVEFKPNDVHNVSGYINIPGFIKMNNIKVETSDVIIKPASEIVVEPIVVETITVSEIEDNATECEIEQTVDIISETKPIKSTRKRNSGARKSNLVADDDVEITKSEDFNKEYTDIEIAEVDNDESAINKNLNLEELVNGKDYN